MAGTGAENRQQEENKQSGQGESSSVQEEKRLNARTSSPPRGRDTFGGVAVLLTSKERKQTQL